MLTRLRPGMLTAALLCLRAATGLIAAAEEDAAPTDKGAAPQTILRYDDNKPDGKKSIAGTGEMIRFELPDESQKLVSLRIHCARYGHPQAPDENAEFSILSDDGAEVIHQEPVPYSTFKRGDSRWTTVRFDEPVTVPKSFWVNPRLRRASDERCLHQLRHQHRRHTLPDRCARGEMQAVDTGGDWMVQAILSKPATPDSAAAADAK